MIKKTKPLKPLPKLSLKLKFSEKISPKKQICSLSQEEIDEYNRSIGYRRSRKKRYGRFGSK